MRWVDRRILRAALSTSGAADPIGDIDRWGTRSDSGHPTPGLGPKVPGCLYVAGQISLTPSTVEQLPPERFARRGSQLVTRTWVRLAFLVPGSFAPVISFPAKTATPPVPSTAVRGDTLHCPLAAIRAPHPCEVHPEVPFRFQLLRTRFSTEWSELLGWRSSFWNVYYRIMHH